ncbi:MAG: TonB-dependent receptor [Thiobacillus sp.]|nr:TonB-dependent receptor [Thiobacillus sp.]
MQRTVLAALIAGLFSLPAWAQEAPLLGEIVVTATRIPTPARELLADVTVITEEQIDAYGHATMADLLRAVPGLELNASGGLGGQLNVHVRGTNANHLLVLVDGQRIGSATLGSTALEHLPLHAVERIELLRAPASSLYGMDAVGGVLQIFTRGGGKGTGLTGFSAGLGAHGLRHADVGLGVGDGPWRLDVSLGHAQNEGFSATNPKALFGAFNPDRDGYRNQSAQARLARRWSDGELSLGLMDVETRTEFDMGTPGNDYSRQALASQSLQLSQRLLPAWDATVRLGRGKDNMRTFGGAPSRFQTSQDQFTWENGLDAWGGKVLLGAEYLQQEVDSTTAFSVDARRIRSLFAGYGGHWGRHLLQVNARNDHNNQFGSRTTGAMSYGFEPRRGLRLHATLATAFKAPTFNDLYFPFTDYSIPGVFTYTYSGNPGLLPERSRNGELGLTWQEGKQSLRATLYRQRISDLIVASNGTSNDFPVNVGTASIDGLELAWQRDWGPWALGGHATFQAAEDSGSGLALPRRARRSGALSLARELGAWSWRGEWLLTGPRHDDLANSRALAGYGLLNLSLSHRTARDWRLEARLDNVLDKAYEQAYGYNTPGRSLFVGVRYQPQG